MRSPFVIGDPVNFQFSATLQLGDSHNNFDDGS